MFLVTPKKLSVSTNCRNSQKRVCKLVHEDNLELDHLFIWVALGAPEMAALSKAGFTPDDDEVNVHDGQGTSSIALSFENAYIELIWVDNEAAAAKTGKAWNTDLLARSSWRKTGACPFGIALRRGKNASDVLPFPVRPFWAEWMKTDDTVWFAESASDIRTPLVFVIPPPMEWAARVERDTALKDSICHPLGARRLTLTQFAITCPIPDGWASGVSDTLRFDVEATSKVVLTLDNGIRGQVINFEPELPLEIRL
jgi:hypothetical protein